MGSSPGQSRVVCNAVHQARWDHVHWRVKKEVDSAGTLGLVWGFNGSTEPRCGSWSLQVGEALLDLNDLA